METLVLDKEKQMGQFGPLWKYISDDNLTNLDWDNGRLWVKYANQIRKPVDDSDVTKEFLENLTQQMKNWGGLRFNPVDNVLGVETDTLRIMCVHESLATSGLSISIRKSLPRLRFTASEALEQGYCERDTLHLLLNCVRSGFNFAFCGEPGKGKTEAAKFFSSFIRSHEKVITVEDIREWHYPAINPGKSCIEMKVSQTEDYEKALETALRLNPNWIMIAETRSREVRYLLEGWSNGVSSMTTLHVEDVRDIPDRILNMLESRQDADRIVNQIYNDVGIGVLLDEVELDEERTKHLISQVCFYYRKDGKNGISMVVEDGKLYPDRIPDFIKKSIERKINGNIFQCKALEEKLQEED